MTRTESGLPWSRSGGENRRLYQVGAVLLLVFFPLAILIPLLEVPEPTREERETVPPQLARMMEEPEPVVEPEPEPDPEPVEPEEDHAEPETEPETEPAPEEPEETVEEAREAAAESGLMAMRDELAGLRDMGDSPEAEISDAQAPGAERATDLGEPDEDGVLAGSGGPESVGRGEAEEGELARRETAELEEQEDAEAASASPDERPMANIREVFDQNKSALFSIYNRALRQDSSLEGEVILELVINASGEVESVEVVDSELGDPELVERIANRVRMFSFGEMDVPEKEVRFPIDFLPP